MSGRFRETQRGHARSGSAAALLLVCVMTAPGAHATPAPPDTGVFAPVARAWAAREAALATARTPAARIHAQIDAGRPDEAWRMARETPDGDPAARRARVRAALAVQAFESAATWIAGIVDDPAIDARTLVHEWAFARDASAELDALVTARLSGGEEAWPECVAAGRLAYGVFEETRAESLFQRALEGADDRDPALRPVRAAAHVGIARVLQRRREWDAALARVREALELHVSADGLAVLAETLIRLGRTDDAIRAAEWGIRFDPYADACHYLLGNGYTRLSYTQLAAAHPGAFAAPGADPALAAADRLHAAGEAEHARAAYGAIVAADPHRVDAMVRLASLDFEQGRFAEARDRCFAALARVPAYGRAHAVLAKALESQRFAIDVHRAEYERRFAESPMPDVPGIERFVVNWSSLTPRHQKRVALSIEPWKAYIPVLVEGGATYFIKPLAMRLGECPNLETLRDQRISYDSRLWDDVRGCGGYHTVTGLEDVERTIFDRYDTVVHELTHQVHSVLPADDMRAIQALYRETKTRDEAGPDAFLSRYAGGSVWEYFAEGVNAYMSPRRDAWDRRDVVRDRLERMDPALLAMVESYLARRDVGASYPVAYAAGGDDRLQRGDVDAALPFYRRALERAPEEETVLVSYASALELGGRAAAAESVATRAVHAHPSSGPARLALASAAWHAGKGLDTARATLAAARADVSNDDRHQVDLALGRYALNAGDAEAARAAFDSVLAYQADHPEGLRGRAAALAMAGREDEAFAQYDEAVRLRTGIVDLRCEYAADLLRAGRIEAARAQLGEAALLDEKHPDAEALRGLAALAAGDARAAQAHAERALRYGEWCDLARIVQGAALKRMGDAAGAAAAWAPVRARIASGAPPEYVYRADLSTWEHVHTLPESQRELLRRFDAP